MTDVTPLEGSAERSLSPDGGDGLLAATLADIDERSRPGPAFVQALRLEASQWLRVHGFPTPKHEAWRFTPLRPLLRVPHRVASDRTAAGGPAPRPLFPDESVALVVNGHPVKLPPPSAGLEVRRFSDVLAEHAERLSSVLGRVVTLRDGFAAANSALFETGLLVTAKKGTSERLHVAFCGGASSPIQAVPRLVIVLEPGSDLQLVETHGVHAEAPYLENGVTEVVVGHGARLEHIRLHEGSRHVSWTTSIAVRQHAESRYVSRSFTFGGALGRETLEVLLDGEGADSTLDGLYTAASGDLVDHHTTIVHKSPRCSSRERYKGVVDRGGVAVFDGTIVVRRGAAGTQAHQENRNLLLSDDAVVHAKPHLEIDTDDVRCSHGATVGRLDPAQLFYLRSRGIDEKAARAALTYAFAREMVDPIADRTVSELVESGLSRVFPGAATAKELT